MNKIIENKIKADTEYDMLVEQTMKTMTFDHFNCIVSQRMWYKNNIKEAMEIYHQQLADPNILSMYQNISTESVLQNHRFKLRHMLMLCNCQKDQDQLSEYELLQNIIELI